MKREQIEALILSISPDTDVHLFSKQDLRDVLAHEIEHLKVQRDRYRDGLNRAAILIATTPEARDKLTPELLSTLNHRR